MLLSALTACGGTDQPEPATASPTPRPLVVTGSVSLSLPDFVWNDKPTAVCAGDGGYDDLKQGARVVVTDNAGATVAIGSIDKTEPVVELDDDADGGYRATSCVLKFTVPEVPAGRGFYGVEVTHRGRVQFSERDLLSPLALTL